MTHKQTGADHKLRVVVIDDQAETLSYRSILELLDIQTYTATTGRMGIPLVAQVRPDVVLLDQRLLDISGYEVAQSLLKNPLTASIPIIMVSAEDDDSHRAKAREIGIHAYIPKPLDADVLRYKINQVLKQEMQLSPPDPALIEKQPAPAVIGALFGKPATTILPTLRFMPRTTWARIIITALHSKRLTARGRAVIALASWQKEPGAPFNRTSAQRAFWEQVRHSLASSTADDAVTNWGRLAQIALALIKPAPQQVDLLKRSTTDEHWLCRLWALRLLLLLREREVTVLAAAALRDDHDDVRVVAAEVLAEMGGAQHLTVLAQAVNDRKAAVRQQAARALAKIDSELALEVLTEALMKSRAGIAETATYGFEYIRTFDAVEVLARAARKRSEPQVLRQIAHTLGAINNTHSYEVLEELARHNDASVRQAAEVYLN